LKLLGRVALLLLAMGMAGSTVVYACTCESILGDRCSGTYCYANPDGTCGCD